MKKFSPKQGQVDFTRARFAPVINCVLMHKNKILIVKRSNKLNLYPGYWNGISGFLDDKNSLRQKVEQEIKEELTISKKDILRVKLGEIFHQEATEYRKTWIVHPILVEIATDRIRLDWEAQDFAWETFVGVKKYNLLPGFSEVLRRLRTGKLSKI